jgi:hypothetical protein
MRAPTQAAVGAAQAQAPKAQRDIKHDQLADDPRRVVGLAFFLGLAGAEEGAGGGGGSGAGKKAGKKKSEAAAAAPAADPWPRLVVLHGTGLACVYRLGPDVLGEQQQEAPAAAATQDGAAAPAAAARLPALAPEATFQASLNARCAALDPGAAAAVRSWRLGATASASASAASRRAPLLAVGSEGTALSLYDLDAKRRVWQAKSPKPDRTGLAERPHHTAVAFLPGVPEQVGVVGGGEGGGDDNSGNDPPIPRFVLLVGTAVHKVHAYDTAVGKRPQASADWGTARITALVPQREEGDDEAPTFDFWAADGIGRAGALELRGLGADGAPAPKGSDGSGGLSLRTPSAGATQGVLRGAAGSVRAVAVLSRARVAGLMAAKKARAGAPREEVVAVAGLDRHVRLYDARTHVCVGRVYAKQQLTGMVWVPPAVVAVAVRAGAAAGAAAAGGEEEGEEEQEEAPPPRRGKKKKSSSGKKSDRDRGAGEDGEGERKKKKKRKSE